MGRVLLVSIKCNLRFLIKQKKKEKRKKDRDRGGLKKNKNEVIKTYVVHLQ